MECVDVPVGPTLSARPSEASSKGGAAREAVDAKRDVLELRIQLDDKRHAEVTMEFFPDSSVAVEWTAFDLPFSLPMVLCLVHEVDLIGEFAPYIAKAQVVHQFPWNEADRLVRVVSQPPIPGISALEIVAQRFGFDLLDTPWGGLCMVESSPIWSEAAAGAGEKWRGARRPAVHPGAKQIDVRQLAALAQPGGTRGELTTLIVSTNAHVKIPRSWLPNWLVSWLITKVGQMIYRHALDRVAKIDSTEHGKRLRGKTSRLYEHLRGRIQAFIEKGGR